MVGASKAKFASCGTCLFVLHNLLYTLSRFTCIVSYLFFVNIVKVGRMFSGVVWRLPSLSYMLLTIRNVCLFFLFSTWYKDGSSSTILFRSSLSKNSCRRGSWYSRTIFAFSFWASWMSCLGSCSTAGRCISIHSRRFVVFGDPCGGGLYVYYPRPIDNWGYPSTRGEAFDNGYIHFFFGQNGRPSAFHSLIDVCIVLS